MPLFPFSSPDEGPVALTERERAVAKEAVQRTVRFLRENDWGGRNWKGDIPLSEHLYPKPADFTLDVRLDGTIWLGRPTAHSTRWIDHPGWSEKIGDVLERVRGRLK